MAFDCFFVARKFPNYCSWKFFAVLINACHQYCSRTANIDQNLINLFDCVLGVQSLSAADFFQCQCQFYLLPHLDTILGYFSTNHNRIIFIPPHRSSLVDPRRLSQTRTAVHFQLG